MASGLARRVQPDRVVHVEHEPAPVRRAALERQGREEVDLALDQGDVELAVECREPSPQLSAGLQGRLHAFDLGAAVQHRVLPLVEQRKVAQLDSVAAPARRSGSSCAPGTTAPAGPERRTLPR